MATQRLRDQFLFPELRAEVHVHSAVIARVQNKNAV